jgi:hypothetical protein
MQPAKPTASESGLASNWDWRRREVHIGTLEERDRINLDAGKKVIAGATTNAAIEMLDARPASEFLVPRRRGKGGLLACHQTGESI